MTIRDKIRAIIEQGRRCMTTFEIAEGCPEIPYKQLRNSVYSMHKNGLLTRQRLPGEPAEFAYGIGRTAEQRGRKCVSEEERIAKKRERDRIGYHKRKAAKQAVEKKKAPAKLVGLKAVIDAGVQITTAEKTAPTPAKKQEPESVAAFLARGGKIQVLPPGACSKRFQLKSMRDIGQETYLRAAEENGWEIRK